MYGNFPIHYFKIKYIIILQGYSEESDPQGYFWGGGAGRLQLITAIQNKSNLTIKLYPFRNHFKAKNLKLFFIYFQLLHVCIILNWSVTPNPP